MFVRSTLDPPYSSADGQRPAPTEPATIIEMELLDLWRGLLAVQDIGVDDDFFERGGDSRLAADMLLEVQQRIGMPLQDFSPPVLTIRAIADAIAERLTGSGGIEGPAQQASELPLFLCQVERGPRGVYAHQLAGFLRARRSVFLLHGPADNARMDIERVAASYLPDVLSVGKSPLFVCGYCMGGLVAWHLAHLLRARGVEVAGLLLIETPSFNGGWGMRVLAMALRRMSGLLLRERMRVFVRDEAMRGFWAMKRKGMRAFIGRLVRRPRAPAEAAKSARHARYEALALTDYERVARFVPLRLDVPVTCLLAEKGNVFENDPSRWRNWAPEVRTLWVPGTHFTAVSRYRAELAAQLEQVMSAVQTPGCN